LRGSSPGLSPNKKCIRSRVPNSRGLPNISPAE
jgi:hypothetical protein